MFLYVKYTYMTIFELCFNSHFSLHRERKNNCPRKQISNFPRSLNVGLNTGLVILSMLLTEHSFTLEFTGIFDMQTYLVTHLP